MNIFQMSFYGAVIILVITVLRAAAKNRLPKKTLLILWGIAMLRLLVPYNLPSIFSVYSFLGNDNGAGTEMSDVSSFLDENETGYYSGNYIVGYEPNGVSNSPDMPDTQENHKGEKNVDMNTIMLVIWLSGTVICGTVFAVMYFRCNFEFKTSLPVQNEFIQEWLDKHKLKRTLTIRQSDKITSPLTYGIFRPVILIPKSAEKEENTRSLQYALMHEYVHVRRFDALFKLICTAAVCLHWFNPAVWLMYVLFNRDIELACDEEALKRLGFDNKAEYARMLIGAEEKRAGITPLYSGFGKNSIKERIVAVMKIKKFSAIAVVAAVILVAAVAVIFATSAVPSSSEDGKEDNNTESLTNTETNYNTENMSAHNSSNQPIFTKEDFEKITALKFDNYEQMTINEYRDRVHKMTDTEEYSELFERFSRYEREFDMENNETAAFVFNTLFPVIREDWQRYKFSGDYDFSSYFEEEDVASFFRLYYNIEVLIKDADTLTVGDYVTIRTSILNSIESFTDGMTQDQLRDNVLLQKSVDELSESLSESYSSDVLRITVYLYINDSYTHTVGIKKENEEQQSEESGLQTVLSVDDTSSEAERAAAENIADPQLYEIYKPYGLTVGNDNKLYYNGIPVRCFDDKISEGFFGTKAIGYYEKDGIVDVRAVRNGTELTGLEAASDEEFNGREIKDPFSDIQTDTTVKEEASFFDMYKEYGPKYDAAQNALFYEGKRVRLFWDSPFVTAAPSASESPFISTISNWDEKGEIDVYVERDYGDKDGNGYGKITGVRLADSGEFEENTGLFSGVNGLGERA